LERQTGKPGALSRDIANPVFSPARARGFTKVEANSRQSRPTFGGTWVKMWGKFENLKNNQRKSIF
jgi:hypothetical protein